LIVEKTFDNKNKKKILIDPLYNLDYSVFDNIYLNFIIKKESKFFYFYKNNIFFDSFLKLTKEKKMKFKYYHFFYLYNHFCFLNKNYYIKISSHY
jgi:hypothetical protein